MAQRDNPAMDPRAPTPLLGGLSPAQFMRRHWQKQPLLVRRALPGAVPPIERAALFALAARDDVESRLVQRSSTGRWTLRQGPLPRRALPPIARPGWTLLVQGLDLHVEAAHALLARFDFIPQARLDDLMLSYASDRGGVGPHTDSYDVFLIQVSGRRRWRYGRLAQPQWRDDVPLKMLATMTVEHDAVLEPGDLLYLPPGWAHEGVALGGECMTASVGFRAATADVLARALIARVADADPSASAASRLYRDPGQAATSHPGAVPPALQRFAGAAVRGAFAAPGALERALGEWITEPKDEVWFESGPTAAEAANEGVRLDRRTRMAYDKRHLFINGESYRATGRDAQLMRQLADTRVLGAGEVRALGSAARALLGEWIAAGWLRALEGEIDAP